MENKKTDPLEIVLYASLFILALSLGYTTYLYTSTFGVGVSNSSSDWSAFGSFFGGVFAPAVSLITLIAIIITIRLQKRFIENQAREFKELNDLQVETLESQKLQLNEAKSSSETTKIATHKQTLLSVISAQMEQTANDINQRRQTFASIQQSIIGLDTTDIATSVKIISAKKNMDTQEREINEYQIMYQSLSTLLVDIALTHYKDLDNLDEHFKIGLYKVLNISSNDHE